MSLSNFISTTSFDDVIKNSFIEQFSSNQLNIGRAAISMLLSLVLGLIIYFIYKKTYRGVVYSATFAMSLVLMTVLTTVIIVTISSNVVLSLGMVGALSIVRFRSAIKDPVDIMYLFWGITMGIVIGAQQYVFAFVASAVIAVICLIMYKISGKANTFLLIVRYHPQCARQIDSLIAQTGARLRNKTSNKRYMEITAEIAENKIPNNLIERLNATDGVSDAVLVNYNGEYCD